MATVSEPVPQSVPYISSTVTSQPHSLHVMSASSSSISPADCLRMVGIDSIDSRSTTLLSAPAPIFLYRVPALRWAPVFTPFLWVPALRFLLRAPALSVLCWTSSCPTAGQPTLWLGSLDGHWCSTTFRLIPSRHFPVRYQDTSVKFLGSTPQLRRWA